MRWFLEKPGSHLERLRRPIEQLSPYPALVILAGPLAVVEPLKFATVFIAGEGHWITSGLVLLFAYAVSLFVTHWLFGVVKPKLLTLPWFAWAWGWFVTMRDKAWRWVRKCWIRTPWVGKHWVGKHWVGKRRLSIAGRRQPSR